MQSHILSPKVENRVSTGFSDDQLVEALKEIFQHYGYDLAAIGVDEKTEIAKRLSEVAQHEPVWGWRYVHNFMMGNIQAGQDFKAAIVGLAAMIDGMPLMVVQGRAVQVTAIGDIAPGAIVYGDSRKCANIACYIHFVPRVWNQRFCSSECKRTARNWKANRKT